MASAGELAGPHGCRALTRKLTCRAPRSGEGRLPRTGGRLQGWTAPWPARWSSCRSRRPGPAAGPQGRAGLAPGGTSRKQERACDWGAHPEFSETYHREPPVLAWAPAGRSAPQAPPAHGSAAPPPAPRPLCSAGGSGRVRERPPRRRGRGPGAAVLPATRPPLRRGPAGVQGARSGHGEEDGRRAERLAITRLAPPRRVTRRETVTRSLTPRCAPGPGDRLLPAPARPHGARAPLAPPLKPSGKGGLSPAVRVLRVRGGLCACRGSLAHS